MIVLIKFQTYTKNAVLIVLLYFQTTQSDYSEIEMKVDAVRRRFDDLTTKCRRVKTGWNNRANGEILFLDRHYLLCRSNEFIHSFLLERRSDVPWSMVRYVYECCKYTI